MAARRALALALLALLAGAGGVAGAAAAAASERPLCRARGACVHNGSNSAKEHFFKVNGRTLNIFYNDTGREFSVRCDEGDDAEPGAPAAADDPALPALPELTDMASAEFRGCGAPAGSYAAALRALNVTVAARLWLLDLPAGARVARPQLAGLGDLRELKLSGASAEAPLRPAPDFLADLPRLRTLRLYRVRAARALPALPAALQWLELKETALPAAEPAPGPAAAHWLLRLGELRRLTLIDEYSPGRLAPPPLGALPRLAEASLQLPLEAPPAGWLAGAALRSLALAGCDLSELAAATFEGAANLTELNVSQNNLTDLPKGVFGSVSSLRELDVSDNGLSGAALERALLPRAALQAPPALRVLVASRNPLGSLCGTSRIVRGRVISGLPLSLRRLELRQTNATRLCSDWLRDARRLAHIDLRDNDIDSLDYSELEMERAAELAGAGGAGVRLLLGGNDKLRALPVTHAQLGSCRRDARAASRARVVLSLSALDCTCDNARLRELLRDCPLLRLAGDVRCGDNQASFLQRGPDQLLCAYGLPCPPGCRCGVRLRGNASVVACEGAAPGAGWPGWAAAGAARPLALSVPGAGLRAVPRAALVELLAPNNSVAALDEADVPETLEVLDLRDNRIERVSEAAAARLRGVRARLAGNPFACACRDRAALARLQDANVSDWDALRCGGAGALRGRLLRGLRPDELCGAALPWLLGGGAAAAALMAGAAAALWPRLRERLKRFLFERQLCLDWVLGAADDVDDPTKTHDAFVSYAHQDHEAARRVLRGLEARGYSTLEHCRDWAPGAAVSEHIIRSVECARRSLLLVSDHYGASRWALEEFRAALAHALKGRSARVLLLRAGLRAPERLPPDLQLHLRLHTYLDLEDPGFWHKLCRAMPPPGAAPAPGSAPETVPACALETVAASSPPPAPEIAPGSAPALGSAAETVPAPAPETATAPKPAPAPAPETVPACTLRTVTVSALPPARETVPVTEPVPVIVTAPAPVYSAPAPASARETESASLSAPAARTAPNHAPPPPPSACSVVVSQPCGSARYIKLSEIRTH